MKKNCLIITGILLVILLFGGCNMPQRVVVAPTDTPEPLVEDTPLPTETPTPLPKREKIAFIPADDVPDVSASITAALDAVCADYDCETLTNADALGSDTDFVIFAKDPGDFSSLKQRFPQTRFIVAAAPGTSYPGVWTIWYDQAYLPFLAGLATAVDAYDWRCAGFLPNDSPFWGTQADEFFLNGAHYLCGNCRSVLAPYVNFPLVISLPGSSSQETWSAQFDEAQRNVIYTVFLADEAVSESMLQKLVSQNIQMVGVSLPPAGLEGNWLATINFDWADTIRQVISRSLSGQTEGTQPLVLSIIPGALTESFSEGKSNVLRQAYSDMLNGKLSPYTAVKEYTEQ